MIRLSELTKEIGDIKARGTRLPDTCKVILAFRELPTVHHFAHSEDDELIEQRDDIASRLMDGKDDSAFIVPSQGDKTLDNIVCIVSVET
jgi:hypothetical protein